MDEADIPPGNSKGNMQIKYMQHAPRRGEPFGTVFVWFSDVSDEIETEKEYVIKDLLSYLSDQWEYPIRILTDGIKGFAWTQIRAERWNTVLAILSFSGGTEIFPPQD